MTAKFLFFRKFLILVMYVKIVEINCFRTKTVPHRTVEMSVLYDDKTNDRIGKVKDILEKWISVKIIKMPCSKWKESFNNTKSTNQQDVEEKKRHTNDESSQKEHLRRLFMSSKAEAKIRTNTSTANKCFTHSFKVLFIKGDESRENCILAIINECTFNNTEAMHEVIQKWKPFSGKLALICVLNKAENGDYVLEDPQAYKKIKHRFPHDNNTVMINYTTKANLLKEMTKLVPMIQLNISDCKYINKTIDGCYYNVFEKKCVGVYTPEIIARPYTIPEAEEYETHIQEGKCPTWKNKIGSCNDTECACEKLEWTTFGSCSVTCGNGTKPAWRNVSRNPTCNKTEAKPCIKKTCPTTTTSTTTTTTLTTTSTTTSTPTTTSTSTTTKPSTSTTTTTTATKSTTPDTSTIIEPNVTSVPSTSRKISYVNATKWNSSVALHTTMVKSSPATEKTSVDGFSTENKSTGSMPKTGLDETSISTVESTMGKKTIVSNVSASPMVERVWGKEERTDQSEETDTWIIVGSIVGAILLVVLIAVMLFLIIWRRRRQRSQKVQEVEVKKKHTHRRRVSTSVRSQREEAVKADLKLDETIRKSKFKEEQKMNAESGNTEKPNPEPEKPNPPTKGTQSPICNSSPVSRSSGSPISKESNFKSPVVDKQAKR